MTIWSHWAWPHFKKAWLKYWREWRGRSLSMWVVRFPDAKCRLSKRHFNNKGYRGPLSALFSHLLHSYLSLPPPNLRAVKPSEMNTWSRCSGGGPDPQWWILLAAVEIAMKTLNGNFSKGLPLGQLLRGPLNYASPPWSNLKPLMSCVFFESPAPWPLRTDSP